jgi:hypothetical protein
MKKLFYLLALALIGAMVIFSAGCSDDDDDTENIQAQEEVGTWIGFYDVVIQEGPNGEPCNAVFFDLDAAGNIKILSFLYGDPAAGHLGTYSIEGNELNLELTHEWAEEIEETAYFNWVEAPLSVSAYIDLSYDGNSMAAGNSETEAWPANKIELSDPEDGLIGDWEDSNGGVLSIDAQGDVDYTLGDYAQSGNLQQFTNVDGETYILINLTYDTDIDAGGTCDYYLIEKFELNNTEDELTLWHGDDVYECTRKS